ncbi:MAG TPA: MFS transporter [Steroidobacteraceae bacterium]|nr:MFS transporter [Steroidobacteraceae bacterium]
MSPQPLSAGARWWLVGVLFVTAIVSYSDRLILSMLVDPLRGDLGLSDSQVGLLQGPVFTLVYVFTALPFGRLADRHSRRRLLLAGATLWCAATVVCGLAPTAGVFLAGRALLGVGEAALIPTGLSLLGDAFPPERRGLALGVFLLGSVVGGPFGITVGGVLLSLAQGGALVAWPGIGALAPWRAVLVTTGVVGLIAPLLILTIADPPRGRVEGTDLTATLRHFLLDRRRLLPLYGGLALLSIGDYGLVSWAPTALTRVFRWNPDRVGIAFGVITAGAGIAGSVLGGWVADLAARQGGDRARLSVAMTGAVLAAAAAAVISGGHANFVLFGLGSWIFIATLGELSAVAVIQDVVPTQFRGTAFAVLTFTNTLVGLGGGPTLIGAAIGYVYRTPAAVDRAISLVGVIAGALACLLFFSARLTWKRSEARYRAEAPSAASSLR